MNAEETSVRERILANRVQRGQKQQSKLSLPSFLSRKNTFIEVDKSLLVRKHKHLIKPYINDQYSRSKLFTNGTYTGVWLISCLLLGYSYAKVQRDEVMRRRYYARYANFMSAFDHFTPILEQKWEFFWESLFSFDSA